MEKELMSIMRPVACCLPALALCGWALGAAAEEVDQGELIVNGSFEQPQLAPNTWHTFLSIPGWRLQYGGSIEIQNRVAGDPADGNQLVELDSYESSGIFQDILTVPGATYHLSLSFSPRPGRSASDNALEIYWDDQFLDSHSRPGEGLANTHWTRLSYRVTATSTVTRLVLADVGISNGYGPYVDAVSLLPE